MGRSCINLVGNTTQGQNLGTGTTVFAGKSTSNTLSFKSLSALGDGISIMCDGDNIYLSGQTGGGSGTTYTFNNGLIETGGVVSWGGTLTGNTLIDGEFDLRLGTYISSCRLGEFETFSNFTCITAGDLLGASSACTSCITMGSGSYNLLYSNSNIGTKSISLHNNNNEPIRISDSYCNVGMIYCADYSANGGTNPRWIPDAAWVTGQTGGGSGTTYTFTTGLTETSNVVSIDTGSIISFGDSFIYWEFHDISFDNYTSIRLDHNSTLQIDRDVPTQESAISMSDSEMRLSSGLGDLNSISIDENRINIVGSGGTLGMTYDDDYSASGSTNPRWIPDNAYVTGITTPAGSDGQLQYNNAGTWGATNLCYDDSTNNYAINTTPTTGTTLTICDTRPYDQFNCVMDIIDGSGAKTFNISHNSFTSTVRTGCIIGVSNGFDSVLYANAGSSQQTIIGGVSICNNCFCINQSFSSENCFEFDSSTCSLIHNAFNVTSRSDFPSTPSEGTMVRLSGHASCSDGYYIYNGTAWQTLSTW